MKFKLLSFRASREISQWEGVSSSLRSIGMTKTLNHDYREKGNVFFYILIAVALFAALSYAVSRNNTGSTDIFTEEQAKLAAQEIIEYGNTVANAVQKLRLRGCKVEASHLQGATVNLGLIAINFGNDINQRVDNTPIHMEEDFTATPSDGSCSVFNSNGGNINAFTHTNVTPATLTGAVFKSGHGSVANRDLIGIGTDGIKDLTWHISDINRDACIKINDLVGVTNPGGVPPLETSSAILGDEAVELVGKTSFCYYRDFGSVNKRHFFHQLLFAF